MNVSSLYPSNKQESFKIVDSLVVLEVFGVFLSIGLWTFLQILAQHFLGGNLGFDACLAQRVAFSSLTQVGP